MKIDVSHVQAREIGRLRAAAPDVRCVVIGAVAVGQYVRLPRLTGDIDLVFDAEPEELNRMLRPLGWEPDERAKQRWRGPNNFLADVLPASSKLIQGGFVQFEDDERRLSLVGFDLLFEHAVEYELPEGQGNVLVATWPTIVVLKIVSWMDRPYERKKDLHDLGTILWNILPQDDERRWDPGIPGDFEEQSPRFAGQEVAKIIGPTHKSAIRNFLDTVLADGSAWIEEVGQGMEVARHAERTVRAFGEGVGELREKIP